MRVSLWLAACAVGLAAACPALAQVANEASYTLDLSPILNTGIQILAAVLLAAGSWAIGRLVQKLKLDGDASVRAYLETALQVGISAAAARAKAAGASLAHPTVRSQAVADVVNYVTPKVPDALARFGITPDHLASMVTARLDAAFPSGEAAADTPAVSNVVNVVGDAARAAGAVADAAKAAGILPKVSSHPLVTAAAVGVTFAVALLLLGGCASLQTISAESSSQQKVYAIKADYAALLTGIAEYERLPRCQAGQTFLKDRCSDAAFVAEIRAEDDKANAAADAAETIVRMQGSGDAVNDAISAAQVALDALRAAYNKSQGQEG